VAPAAMDHQPVEEVRQHRVAAFDVTVLVVLLQERFDIRFLDREIRVDQLGDLHHLAVAEVEHVADAAQYVVVDHGGPGFNAGNDSRPQPLSPTPSSNPCRRCQSSSDSSGYPSK